MSKFLRSLSDRDLITRTQQLTAQERNLTLNVLLHLNEIERRKLHLKCGHATLFAYCTAGLKYSAAAAMRRIQSARCLARFPEVQDLLAAGEVNLSTISQVASVLTPENRSAILERIRGMSQREVEVVVAEYQPLAAVPRDRVRTIMVRVPVTNDAGCFRSGSEPGPDDVSHSRSGNKPLPRTESSDVPPRSVPAKPLAGAAVLERKAIVQFTASEAVMNKLERIRSLASHRLPPNASLEQLIDFMADYVIQREDPAVREARRKARAAQPVEPTRRAAATPAARSHRQIPARVRDQVFTRDRQQCTYVGPNGKRCGATHVLQIDHIQPVARGGAGTLDNLRLLCAHHNRLEAERLMGCRGGP
ncbi:MAG TPA: HNH endonuclease signature motif containing protein [Candidatus Krumholzibacteria bacterium]|nr:HNH endonuclease signature motif containing protein [Candidatus Krumholzibacteria bacterium]